EVFEARCELVAATEDWKQAPDASREARAHAEYGARHVAAFADRLEGRAALRSHPARARDLLQRAATTLSELGIIVDAARTRIDLAISLLSLQARDEAAAELDAASAIFEPL